MKRVSSNQRALFNFLGALLVLGLLMLFGFALHSLFATRASQIAGQPGSANSWPVVALAQSFPSPAEGGSQVDSTAEWPTYQGKTHDGLVFSFKYPASLSWQGSPFHYCLVQPTEISGFAVPPGCVTMDIIGRQSAMVLKTQISGETISVAGHRAIREIQDKSETSLGERIYTTLLCDKEGEPVFSVVAYFGIGTDSSTLDSLTQIVDQVLSTVQFQE